MSEYIDINFGHTPSVYRALISNASFAGILGPVGSGKSHGCSGWIMGHADKQRVQRDGYKRSRYAVIRNTGPELKSTTIKTFEGIFPAGPHGRPVYSAPITYRMNFPPRRGAPGLDCEVIFLALDNVNDIRKLLSLELTGAWINEGREVVGPVVDALLGRIGRFPSMADGGCIDPQVICDTNAPDEDSWFYERFENNSMPQMFTLPDGRVIDLTNKLFRQPPAVLELKEISGNRFESVEQHWDNFIYEEGEVIRAANKLWGINPEAENLANLDPAYYARQLVGANLKYIQVMLQGKYGFFQIGKPVVPEFNHDLQVVDIPVLKDQPLKIGVDIGGGTLQPAAIIGQRHPRGVWLAHSEVIGKEMGVENFARVLKQHVEEKYPGMQIEVMFLDPAAEKRDELFENKIVEYMRAKGFPTRCASTNDWRVRRQAIADPCGRLIDGRPGLLISKTGCPKLINGLKGKWDFKKLQTSGVEAYSETPSKNEYSHPCEALGYLLLGGGEARPMVTTRTTSQTRAFSGGFTAKQKFDL